jgi:hypothetical protein
MQIEHKGDQIIATIDVGRVVIEEAKPSSSGKTRLVASTNGFRRVGPVSISLNVTAPNPDHTPAR